jgi:Reverse transcriptase (RNA-dependent DNA polymerase)/Zinc knuckle
LDARIAYYTCNQAPNQSDFEYLAVFRANVEVLEYYKANIGESYLLIDDAGATLTTQERTELARGRTIAMAFLRGSDPRRYAALMSDLANQKTRGNDQYPIDLTAAYSMLVNYHVPVTSRVQQQNGLPNTITAASQNSSDVGPHTFAQSARSTTTSTTPNTTSTTVRMGTDGVLHDGITCFHCNSTGHYANQCPGSVSLLQFACVLTQQSTDVGRYEVIPSSWILLDSQSNISVFNNKQMVTNIRVSPQEVCDRTNGGEQTSTHIADFKNLGVVWYNPELIANILSLSEVRKKCRVTMDTAEEPAMIVHRTNGTILKFTEHTDGLYFFDSFIQSNDTSIGKFSFVETVAQNKSVYVTREIEAADKARALYRNLGRPSQKQFEDVISKNVITNCPVNFDDVRRALLIYGPDLATLKGKTTQGRAATHVPNFVAEKIPAPILQYHKNVTLCMDFFFVQGQAFFHVISRKIKHRFVVPVTDRTKATMLKHVTSAIKLYQVRGFNVTDIHADVEFECLRQHLMPINLNIAASDSHVGEIERSIRTIKERNRSTVHGLPYKRLPKLMVKEVVRFSVNCLNQLPAEDGVSTTLSPNTIMTGKSNPDYNNMRVEFGSYVQIYEPTTFATNTLRSRTTGAIALTATGNAQGDYYFMSLVSGRRLSRHEWTPVPITDAAIERVEQIAAEENQSWVQNTGLLMEWRPEDPLDDDDDPDYVYTEDVDDTDYDDIEWDETLADIDTISTDIPTELDSDTVHTNHSVVENLVDNIIVEENEDDMSSALDSDEDPAQNTEEEDTDENELETQGNRYNLRPSRQRSYDHRLDHMMDEQTTSKSYEPSVQLVQHSTQQAITAYVLTQMSAAAGIKIYGQPAVDAILKEFCQLHDKGVFEPKQALSLTIAQKKGSLRAVNLIKEKRSGDIKGRTCADGSVQRSRYTKTETSSPTVSNEALMYTILVDAKERRDVATADVVGAYLNAEMDDFTLMKLSEEAVNIMVQVNELYLPFVSNENGKQVLYLQLKKALYGCVKSALLWYDLFSSTLLDMGFQLNPYDACVANKMIIGTQCTIVWYVDDNKISHISPAVVSDVIEKIEEKFGKMTVTRGDTHVFLGMNFTFNGDGTATISMKNYLEEAIIESKLDVTKTVTTPAQKHLFDIDETSPLLPKSEAELFHSVVAKLLYVSIRARPDILLAVSFLCTRVSKSTRQDQQKLLRLLQYISGTLDITLTIGADDLSSIRTWVDASYAVHPDMKSHTGGLMSMGTGGLVCKSSKQKLNTKSSTEAELVGATDYLPNTIWSKLFLEAQ